MQNPDYNCHSEATHFERENVKTTDYGIQSIRYLGPKIWDMVPNNIKNCSSLNKLKNGMKPSECACRFCKKYIAQVGFIWFTSTSSQRSLPSWQIHGFWGCQEQLVWFQIFHHTQNNHENFNIVVAKNLLYPRVLGVPGILGVSDLSGILEVRGSLVC